MANITIKDVAKYAGVSTATVSRVINGYKSVNEETKKKVYEAIKHINYVPNASARNLKTARSNVIGFLVSNISNSHFTSMAKIIESIFREKDYCVIVCNTDDDPELELNHLNRLVGMRVDGLILNTSGKNDSYISKLSLTIPIVLVDRNISNPDFLGDFVGSNNFEGIRSLTQHLIKYGHRKIGIITSNLAVSTGRERLSGFQAAMQEIGIRVDENYIYRYDSKYFNFECGIAGCRYLMTQEDPPTAIVIANNDMAIGAYHYLRTHNIAVPEDVSIVSYGNISNSDLFWIQPTYATLNPQFIGEKAAHYLLSRIEKPDQNKREAIYQPSLVINGSTMAV